MIKLRSIENDNKKYRPTDDFNVDVLPDRAFRIFGINKDIPYNKMFQVGDRCVATGFKEPSQRGIITRITDKTVVITRDDGSMKHFKYYNFIWKNWI